MHPTPETADALLTAANDLADLLKQSGRRIVFAESCTAGLVSATLARIPGISEHLCGSAVTYRNDTKMQWLEISANSIAHAGVVSGVVAKQMAAGVLATTPEADLVVTITGHLGPNAPEELDGVVHVGTVVRGDDPAATRHVLPADVSEDQVRLERQHLAAAIVLQTAGSLCRDHFC